MSGARCAEPSSAVFAIGCAASGDGRFREQPTNIDNNEIIGPRADVRRYIDYVPSWVNVAGECRPVRSGRTQTVLRSPRSAMLRLNILGQPVVERDGKPLGGAARQRRVIALLAVVAAGRDRGVSRDRLLGLLWSERDETGAHSSLYHARRALSHDDVFFASADHVTRPPVLARTRSFDVFTDTVTETVRYDE